MEPTDEILKQKITSIYQILLWFLIVDWDIENLEEEPILDFITENYWIIDIDELSLEKQIKIIAEDPDNFARNAVFLNIALTRDEKIDTLVHISDVIYADLEFSDSEYDLYYQLMDAWNIEWLDDLKQEER